MVEVIKLKKFMKDYYYLGATLCGVFLVLGLLFFRLTIFSNILFSLAIICGGYEQTKDGILEIINDKHLNVDLLMALAAIGACIIGDFREGALLTLIFSVSNALEEYTTQKSRRELTHLLTLQPKTAQKIIDGKNVTVPVEELVIGDNVFVPNGASLPIDGILLSNYATVSQAAITGESLPVEKLCGADLFGGSLNVGAPLTLEVSKGAEETVLAGILQLVKQAEENPSPTASFINRIEDTYVKVVLTLVPLAILFLYFVMGWTFSESFYRGMVLLVVASPCALVASVTPAALAAISNGARNGIIFKGGTALENLADVSTISFDKTGTLTRGLPELADSYYVTDNFSKEQLAHFVHLLEMQSTHPLAKALVAATELIADGIELSDVTEISGFGMSAAFSDDAPHTIRLGKIEAVTLHDETLTEKINQWQSEGLSTVGLSIDDKLVAIFALGDTIQPTAAPLLNYMHQNHIQTTLLTGDHAKVADTLGKKLGIDHVASNLLPAQKAEYILKQKEDGTKNAMVGDGINDAPALANATVGIAMGNGTDIAIDVADIVILQNNLERLTLSFRLSKKMKTIVYQNIIFSVSVIITLILCNFLQIINMPIGVLGHEGSTILVILNSLRLLKNMK